MNKVILLIIAIVVVLVSCKTKNIVDVTDQVKIDKIKCEDKSICFLIEEIKILETAKKNSNLDIGLSLKLRIINKSNSEQIIKLFDSGDILRGNIVGLHAKCDSVISFVNNFEEPTIKLIPNQEYIYMCTSVLFYYECLFENNIDYQEAMIDFVSNMKFKYMQSARSLTDAIDVGFSNELTVVCID